MWKSKFVIWTLAAVFICGCGGTSCETQQAAQPPPSAPQIEKQAPPKTPVDLLTFHEVFTAGAQRGDNVPLIIAVHGLGDKPINFASLFDDLPIKARVVLPRAPDPWGGGWAWFPYRSRDQDPKALAKGIRDAAKRVADLAEHLAQGAPKKPVICGFSQGGMISYAVALLHPRTISGAVPISGTIPVDLMPGGTPKREDYPPIRALHGNANQIVAFVPTERAIRSLKDQGLDVKLEVFEGVGHSVIAPMQAYLYKTLGTLVP